MYVGPQLRPYMVQPKWTRRWALLLVFGYFLYLLMELLMLRFTKGTDGHWVVQATREPSLWLTIFVISVGVFSLLCSIGFIISYFRERRTYGTQTYQWSLTSADFLHVIAWFQILNTYLLFGYGFLFTYPIFPEGSIGGIIESASLQLFILIVAIFRFWGRWEVIGFSRPKHLIRMLFSIAAILVFVVVALDFLLTNPIADWLNLSLQSQRETEIEQGIVQAKTFNWLNGLVSVLVVGVFVPIAEEILFRGVIQTFLVKRIGAVLGILVTSFWFALMHVDIALFVPLFVIGLGLGFVRHRYQSIWGAIILHSLNNLASAMHYFT